jgi:hypothetical protein
METHFGAKEANSEAREGSFWNCIGLTWSGSNEARSGAMEAFFGAARLILVQ